MAPDAFFLPVADGQRFCLYHAPSGTPRGAIIYIHPFAEEMNKSRRMAALQSRLLAANGFAVLQIDLHGCGDSSGDFSDASWQSWLDDIVQASAWIKQHCSAPLWLWGLRAGCLLAADAARRLDIPVNFLFWQPAVSGKPLLQQFLRLKVAGEMISGDGKGVMAAMKQRLATGQSIEVAGYMLSSDLANGMEDSQLLPPSLGGRLCWFEISSREQATLAPASEQCIERWRSAGFDIQSAVLPGLTFWQTIEIEEAPALLAATTRALAA